MFRGEFGILQRQMFRGVVPKPRDKLHLVAYISKERIGIWPRCFGGNLEFYSVSCFGMWRSLVAYAHGVRVVAGSNPVIPTNHYSVGIKALSSD